MGTENLESSALDAKPAAPAAPPANYIDASLIPEQALEHLDRFMTQADRDKLEAARIAGREEKRAAAKRAAEESAASSKRAADAVKEVVERDAATPESEKPTGEKTEAHELQIPPMLTADQAKIAEG